MSQFVDVFSVRGKSALVTGGTRGIGYMIAEGLLRAGARVYVSSRKPQACRDAEARLAPHGDVHAIACDVSDREQCSALLAEVAQRESGLDILVNNAGSTWGSRFDDFPEAGWDKVLAVNLKAPFILTQLARPLLENASTPADPARIINIGSIDGMTVPRFGNYSYSASKAAIHHLTRHMAADLAPSILVNAIAPGPFPSKMTEKPLHDHGDRLIATSPVNRIGRSDDIAAAVVYLASRASTFMTGAVLPVDGGLSTTIGIHL